MSDRQTPQSNLRALGLRIGLSLAIVGVISGVWSYEVSGTSSTLLWWGNWLQDVGTEMLGAAVTILLVELVIYQKRDEASRLDQERMRRREQFASKLKRARTSQKRQQIIDSMKRQNLLAGAWLYEVDLHAADLQTCDLEGADLFEANLSGAMLKEANLKNANLQRANLRHTTLVSANLEAADLIDADLHGADLTFAQLRSADLSSARFSTQTRLPDGRLWEPTIDVETFVRDDEAD